jgi:glutathione S-transferase
MLKLYISKGSSALAPHILLEEAGADYTIEEKPIASGAHLTPAYLAINPKGRVPALETKDGVITENPAILWYLGETFPHRDFLPGTPYQRAKAQELNAYICATVHVAFAHAQRGHRWADDPAVIEGMKPKVAANMRDCAGLIETHYLKGPWALGERYSICDPYLFLVQRWLGIIGIPVADYPKLAAHREAMMSRPATQTVLAAHGL